MSDKPAIKKFNISNITYSLICVGLVITALIYFANIFKPIFLAAMFWFIVNALKTVLSKIKIGGKEMPRLVKNALALLIIIGVIFFIFDLISAQFGQMSNRSEAYYEKGIGLYDDFSAKLNNPEAMERFSQRIENFDYGSFAQGILRSLSGFLGDFAVILIYVIFFLLEEGNRRLKIGRLFSEKDQFNRFMNVTTKINVSIKKYFVSKTFISLLTAVFSYIILLIFQVDFAILWAFIIFILNFIPYLGSFIATLFPALFATFQFGNPWYFVYIFVTIQLVQIVLGNLVEPKMMGKSLNLGPVTVFMSILFKIFER